MFTSIAAFEETWGHESASTLKIFNALTDASLKQEVTSQDRTLGRIAWHITTTLHEMLSRTGLDFAAPENEEQVPGSAQEIVDAYRTGSEALISAIKNQWTDATLLEKVDMYGEQWPNGVTLQILISHQIHHRGQMTILMRQAGLSVPGVYGPSRDEWSLMGMEPPAV
ncbi:hypothetical protein GC093_00950 [Paenibacillus sp. LMG 31456]|uniref:Damage-inducible protein DinB n=1 Tax=Paenibacillus foliorum TaxID=2654974 RepID=A0A972K0L0_9BACL|nr:DinB family protein [Paenibacillus foliorum]NOU91807.1 hypothetical protein [Paenibacillus foliorum]